MKPESSGDPLIDMTLRTLGRLMPVEYANAISEEQYALLQKRNRLLDGISCALCVVGIISGVLLALAVPGHRFTFWDVGVQFGLAAGLPTLFIFASAGARGRLRLREFFVFYSLKYGVSAQKLFLFGYGPMIVLGLICAYFSYIHPILA